MKVPVQVLAHAGANQAGEGTHEDACSPCCPHAGPGEHNSKACMQETNMCDMTSSR